MMCWRPALGTRSEIANIKNLLRARKAGAPEGLLFANLCWISCNRLVEKARKPPRSEPTLEKSNNSARMMVMKGWRDVLPRVRKAGRPRRSVIGLRTDFDAQTVRSIAEELMDRPQARRRLLAVAAIFDGATRTEAAKIAGVTAQTVREWVMRFNVDGLDGLINF